MILSAYLMMVWNECYDYELKKYWLNFDDTVNCFSSLLQFKKFKELGLYTKIVNKKVT